MGEHTSLYYAGVQPCAASEDRCSNGGVWLAAFVIRLGRTSKDKGGAVRDEERQLAGIIGVFCLDQTDAHAWVGDDQELTAHWPERRISGEFACAHASAVDDGPCGVP